MTKKKTELITKGTAYEIIWNALDGKESEDIHQTLSTAILYLFNMQPRWPDGSVIVFCDNDTYRRRLPVRMDAERVSKDDMINILKNCKFEDHPETCEIIDKIIKEISDAI